MPDSRKYCSTLGSKLPEKLENKQTAFLFSFLTLMADSAILKDCSISRSATSRGVSRDIAIRPISAWDATADTQPGTIFSKSPFPQASNGLDIVL